MRSLVLSSSILLIDSDRAVQDSLHEHFSDSMLDVCASSQQAGTLLLNTPYQLVICGMNMALGDHCFVLKHSRLYTPFAPFIVMTRNHEGAFVGQAIDGGALDLLLEPFASINNTRTVRSLLWLYRLRKQVAR